MRLKKSKDQIIQEMRHAMHYSIHGNFSGNSYTYRQVKDGYSSKSLNGPEEMVGWPPGMLAYMHNLVETAMASFIDNIYTDEEFERDIGIRKD